MVYEFSFPIKHATWGAYQMLGSYKMRFKYLRDVLYMQKNGLKKGKATFKAMRGAYEGLGVNCDIALIDGNQKPGLPCEERTIVKGDAKSQSISASS